MFVDIVFPKDNEKKFIKIAKELGYNGLCFVYTISKFNKIKFEKLKKENFEIYSCILSEKPSKNLFVDPSLFHQNIHSLFVLPRLSHHSPSPNHHSVDKHSQNAPISFPL